MPTQEKSQAGGVWYHLYLRPEWRLIADTRTRNGMQTLFWLKTIVPMLVEHYKLDDAARLQIGRLWLAMPHGTACTDGDDAYLSLYEKFPKGLSKDGELKKIISALGLTPHLLKKRLYVRSVKVTGMKEETKVHRTALQKVIGAVPY